MSDRLPVYAPVVIDFDVDRIRAEFEAIDDKLFVEIADLWAKREYDPALHENWRIGTLEQNTDCDRYILENGRKVLIQGKHRMTYAADFTWVPGEPTSAYDKSVVRNGRPEALNDLYPQPWTWRPEFHLPYFRSVAESLPFEYIQKVRLLRTPAGAPLRVHRDDRRNTTYYARGFGQMNLNIIGGGSTLMYKIGEKIHSAPFVPACHFNASYLHGVEPVANTRMTVQIYGKRRPDYIDHLDLSRAVWDEASSV